MILIKLLDFVLLKYEPIWWDPYGKGGGAICLTMFLASNDIDQAPLIWFSWDISQSDGIPMGKEEVVWLMQIAHLVNDEQLCN